MFNVIISIMSMLGFYAYLPDINAWLRVQPDFPLKQSLLELDRQTLQLVVFTFLLFIVLAKVKVPSTRISHSIRSLSVVRRGNHLVLLWIHHGIEHRSIHWNSDKPQ
jgi:hypothetical protein